MEDIKSQIREYLGTFKQGYREKAYFGLIEMNHNIIPDLIDEFRKEKDTQTRAFLVEVIWQHRQQSIIPFLAEVLNDPAHEVWKEAMDGLVALHSPDSVAALRSAKLRKFSRQKDTLQFRKWLEEAIEQAEA